LNSGLQVATPGHGKQFCKLKANISKIRRTHREEPHAESGANPKINVTFTTYDTPL
jgi:hypothetical protein